MLYSCEYEYSRSNKKLTKIVKYLPPHSVINIAEAAASLHYSNVLHEAIIPSVSVVEHNRQQFTFTGADSIESSDCASASSLNRQMNYSFVRAIPFHKVFLICVASQRSVMNV